ncbi:AP-3 complex subunit delta-1 [Acropora cervicornis]|uniref:AP-3 complex subunit delta-1 n=1 Tax=Acropora cervicornis TaxID=6130 RepID=A0AAD9QYQ8_ACRCE|nr:AP-3 complex subunit delta-1 [Acropora cervicornis]
MFEKNLTDLVRGIRNNKSNEAKYIASCLDEIKQELRQENAVVKANAVAKLTYLQMLGYDITWAAFNIIEVMSSSKFTFKRVGYLAASQSFHEELDILMLTTNMIRKDLCSMNMYDAGVSLSGFSCFVTPDLARDLANDVMSLLVSTKPYIRKRAVLLMYKIFLKVLRTSERSSWVQSAAVNVICELARKNPKNYLSLAPLFFKLMTNSTNNWMLIKIIKLFGALCPLEPRLGKKLLEPLTNLIHSTSAMSLLYECINTVVSVKYLGLLAMSKILAVNPKAVQAHKDIVLQCLDDKDESIRLRALDLIVGMVIIDLWYIDVLIQLTRVEGTRHGKLLASQMMDVTIRVKAIRPYAVQCVKINNDYQIHNPCFECDTDFAYASEVNISATLDALLQPKATSLPGHIQAVYVQNIVKLYAKLLANQEEEEDAVSQSLGEMLVEKLSVFVQSADLEVQERRIFDKIVSGYCYLKYLGITQFSGFVLWYCPDDDIDFDDNRVNCIEEVSSLFRGELNPVAAKAQKKVQVPEGLDLDKWINDPPSDSSEEEEEMETIFETANEHMDLKQKYESEDEEEMKKEKRKELAVDEIPMANIELPVSLKVSRGVALDKKYASKKTKKRRKKGRKGSQVEEDEPDLGISYEGANESDNDIRQEEIADASEDPHKLLDIDLSKPLEAHEALPVRQHRVVNEKQPCDENEEETTPKKHRKGKKHRHRKESESKKPSLMLNGEIDHHEYPNNEEEVETPVSNGITELEDFKPSLDTPGDPQDDMDFWLSPTPEKISAPKSAETPKESLPHDVPAENSLPTKLSEKNEGKESKHKHRKDKSDRKERHEKERKKEKRKSKTSEKSDNVESPAAELEKQNEPTSLEFMEEKKQMYETRVTTRHRNQVVVSVIFSNLTDRHIKSMEFNVLDSLNTQLIRPIGYSSRDSVPVPFHLLPDSSNEGQFAFTVENIVMSQKLRGTLTYDDEGSTSEKMDFSLFLPCSSFLISTPLSSTDFANLLGSGTLANKSSVKVTTPETAEFNTIITKICVLLHFAVVEQIDLSASLYASSIQGHHLCALVKQLPDHSVTIDGKSTDASLVSNVLEEVKLLLQSP